MELLCAYLRMVGKVCMKHRIESVDMGSPAASAGICAGCYLLAINSQQVYDVIDYEQLTAHEQLDIELSRSSNDGDCYSVHVAKELYEPLGLNFDSSLMSPIKQCANHCVFCFIDQMPHGNRGTLYFKDDDWRLSLIMGNYVTLTNVSDNEFQRIIRRRVSPLYISVHATDGSVRKAMMRSANAERIMERLKALRDANLSFHCQIVLCPGYNDGNILERTMNDLYSLHPQCLSVAVVPVGLTKHRDNLIKLEPITKQIALNVISQIDVFKREHGIQGFIYASDEMYLCAELELPSYEDYGDFEQIENGVGLYRQFEYGFMEALKDLPVQERMLKFDSICGVSIAPNMEKLFKRFIPYNIAIDVHAVRNDFFGNTVTVSGLITARDIIAQCKGKLTGEALLLPHTMLRENDEVFLDGMTISELSSKLGLPIFKVTADDGYDFTDDIVEIVSSINITKN